MQANKLQKLAIILKVVYYTFISSASVIVLSLFKKLTRQKVDHISQSWGANLIKAVKATYTLHNPHNVSLQPGKAYIVMSNHISHFDIPFLFQLNLGSLRMIAKKELFRIPIFGTAMKYAEYISIDRGNRQEAMRNLEYAKKKMQQGVLIWVAPEGTRSRNGKLGLFKKGAFMMAFHTQATIIPVAIKGTDHILAPEERNAKLKQHVDLHICEPIETSDYKMTERDELIVKVKESIQRVVELDSVDAD